MNKEVINMELEIIIEDGEIVISEEGSSGCTYEYTSKDSIVEAVKDYVENYMGEIEGGE